MSNPEHLERLRSGAEAWNRWRRENPTIWPNLMGANLDGLDLSGFDLENANLLEATLRRAVLSRARLRNCNLKEAKLREADLRETNLREANLYKADLESAQLDGADLRFANLTRANLDYASLRRVLMSDTTFGQMSLAKTLHLDKVIHQDPSSIDVHCLDRTIRDLAEPHPVFSTARTFFHGLGVPSHVVDYCVQRALGGRRWYSCFISYSHQDKDFVGQLTARLAEPGIPHFLDERGFHLGHELTHEARHAIKQQDKLLLACSEASLTSDWVLDEVRFALELEKPRRYPVVVPLDLDSYVFHDAFDPDLREIFKARLAAKFIGWRQDPEILKQGLDRVVESLQITAP